MGHPGLSDGNFRTGFRAADFGLKILLAEVAVVFVDPVLAGRGEDVEVDGVFEGDGGVGKVGGEDDDFAGVDGVGGAVVEVEADRALEDEGELFVGVRVARDDASLGEDDAAEHGLVAGDELAGEERVELLWFDFAPAMEGCGGHERCLSSGDVSGR
jgi:hypothetical protein